jgi:hypothetical protein
MGQEIMAGANEQFQAPNFGQDVMGAINQVAQNTTVDEFADETPSHVTVIIQGPTTEEFQRDVIREVGAASFRREVALRAEDGQTLSGSSIVRR